MVGLPRGFVELMKQTYFFNSFLCDANNKKEKETNPQLPLVAIGAAKEDNTEIYKTVSLKINNRD